MESLTVGHLRLAHAAAALRPDLPGRAVYEDPVEDQSQPRF
jgi:hypothetical protein